MYYPRNLSVDLFTSPPISSPLRGQVKNGAMMLYPASHWLGGLPQWSTDEEDVNGSGISESDMRAVRAQASPVRPPQKRYLDFESKWFDFYEHHAVPQTLREWMASGSGDGGSDC